MMGEREKLLRVSSPILQSRASVHRDDTCPFTLHLRHVGPVMALAEGWYGWTVKVSGRVIVDSVNFNLKSACLK
jgi:hypothetical protein